MLDKVALFLLAEIESDGTIVVVQDIAQRNAHPVTMARGGLGAVRTTASSPARRQRAPVQTWVPPEWNAVVDADSSWIPPAHTESRGRDWFLRTAYGRTTLSTQAWSTSPFPSRRPSARARRRRGMRGELRRQERHHRPRRSGWRTSATRGCPGAGDMALFVTTFRVRFGDPSSR